MFRITVNTYDVAYTFRHTRDVNFEVKPGKLVTDVTSCLMTINNEEFNTVAACAREDNFCKANGRKIALTRALSDAQLPKTVRTAIWTDYFKRVN